MNAFELLSFRNVAIFVGLLSAASLTLLVGLTCFPQQRPPVTDILEVQHYRTPPAFPMRVSLPLQSRMTRHRIEQLEDAADRWYRFTGGVAEIIVEEDGWELRSFDPEYFSASPRVTAWLRSKDDPEVTPLLLRYSVTADGMAIGNMLVFFDEARDDAMVTVMSHELGHVMGLEHVKREYPALMNPGGNGGRFTSWDTLQFCSLHDCDGR